MQAGAAADLTHVAAIRVLVGLLRLTMRERRNRPLAGDRAGSRSLGYPDLCTSDVPGSASEPVPRHLANTRLGGAPRGARHAGERVFSWREKRPRHDEAT